MNRYLLALVSVGVLMFGVGCQQLPEEGAPGAGQPGVTENPSDEISEEVKTLLNSQDLLNEIVKSGDLSRCKEFDMEQYARSCEVNILSSKARTSGDTSICDDGSTDAIKQQCKALVEKNAA